MMLQLLRSTFIARTIKNFYFLFEFTGIITAPLSCSFIDNKMRRNALHRQRKVLSEPRYYAVNFPNFLHLQKPFSQVWYSKLLPLFCGSEVSTSTIVFTLELWEKRKLIKYKWPFELACDNPSIPRFFFQRFHFAYPKISYFV